MAAEDENTQEQRGSIVPGVAGAAIAGTGGAIWGFNSSQKKAVKAANFEGAIEGTPLGLVKQHIAAGDQGHAEVRGEWDRLVTQENKAKPVRPDMPWSEKSDYKRAVDAKFKRETKLQKLNNEYHELAARVEGHEAGDAKRILQGRLSQAESALHNAAAEHIVLTHDLKPLEENIAKGLGDITKKMPRGSFGKAAVVGTTLAAVGGLAAQAMFGRAERPHNSHAARVRAEQAAAAQQQGAQI